MTKQYSVKRRRLSQAGIIVLLSLLLTLGTFNDALCGPRVQNRPTLKKMPYPREEIDLGEIPFKILYETYRKTDGRNNWELYQMNADGSNQVNLTRTPDLDEMYPHASPDGTKISFVIDEGSGRRKVRSVYYMNVDGPDGKKIAYLLGEYDRYSTREYATSELIIYDLQSRQYKPHPNTSLHHIYAICWSPDGNWFFAAVHGGMNYSDTVLAIDADGTRVFDLEKWGVRGCRPDISRDGKRMTWGETDWDLSVGDIDLTGPEPRLYNVQKIVQCLHSAKVYHVDFSPDGKYIAFSFGSSSGGQQVGGKARGWNICVTDLKGKWVKITTDGSHNKEPDWVPIPSADPEVKEIQ